MNCQDLTPEHPLPHSSMFYELYMQFMKKMHTFFVDILRAL